MTVTTDEAAQNVGVKPSTIRQWVRRGYLKPIRTDAVPLRFHDTDVTECHRLRRSKGETERIRRLAASLGVGHA